MKEQAKELIQVMLLGIAGAVFILAINAIGITLVYLSGRSICNYFGW